MFCTFSLNISILSIHEKVIEMAILMGEGDTKLNFLNKDD